MATALVAAAMGKGIGSVGGRWTFWRAAAQLIVRRPFLGYGLGRFQAVYPYGAAYLAAEGTPLALPASAHNDWLEFAVELGVVPALLLLATALWACWSSWKQGRVHVALALSALVLQAAWDAPLHATPTALLFFMLLGSAGSRSRAAFVGRVMPASVGLTVALIAASAVTLAGWGTIQDRVRGHVVGARAAHAASVGEWGRATHGWQQARELAPGDGVFSYWLSQGLAATGDFEAALREARRAGRTYARFDLYVLLAQLEHHVGCPARAVETLEWILEGFPRYTRARLLLDRYESDGNAVGR